MYQTSPLFSNYDNISLQGQIDTNFVEQALVREMGFDVGQVINDVQKEEIRSTIDKLLPNISTEERITAEDKVMYEMKFKNKDLQYIAKLK